VFLAENSGCSISIKSVTYQIVLSRIQYGNDFRSPIRRNEQVINPKTRRRRLKAVQEEKQRQLKNKDKSRRLQNRKQSTKPLLSRDIKGL
jgi:hypothetical protein